MHIDASLAELRRLVTLDWFRCITKVSNEKALNWINIILSFEYLVASGIVLNSKKSTSTSTSTS